MTSDKISKYFARIGYTGAAEPTLATLTRLQELHMQTIPFENLDVYYKRPLNLAPDALFDKVILRQRGGYCFELNTLYGELLAALGFVHRPVLARVLLRDPVSMPARNHMAHLVQIGAQTYLTDVGFGGLTTRIPLNIYHAGEVEDSQGLIRIQQLTDTVFKLQRLVGTTWQDQYSLETTEVYPNDILVANFYVEHSPDSHFTQRRYVGLFTVAGRIGLVDDVYTQRSGLSDTQQMTATDEAAWKHLVNGKFGLPLNEL